MDNFRTKDLPVRLPKKLTNVRQLDRPVLEALEHARDPGADPGLMVLARALEEEIAHGQCR